MVFAQTCWGAYYGVPKGECGCHESGDFNLVSSEYTTQNNQSWWCQDRGTLWTCLKYIFIWINHTICTKDQKITVYFWQPHFLPDRLRGFAKTYGYQLNQVLFTAMGMLCEGFSLWWIVGMKRGSGETSGIKLLETFCSCFFFCAVFL